MRRGGALASLGGDEAKASLLRHRKHNSEVIRAAVVAALARLGATDTVLEAASDKSWLVREAVARSLVRDAAATAEC